MKKMIQAATMAVAILAVPAFALAQTPAASTAKTMPASKSATKTPAAKSTALHSTHGVVKSMDASSLVISPAGKKGAAEMRFTVDPSTQKEGDVAVGANVTVKYHNDASTHVAADIKATPAKAAKTSSKKKS